MECNAPSHDWLNFTTRVNDLYHHEAESSVLITEYGKILSDFDGFNSSSVHECRMGMGHVYYKLAKLHHRSFRETTTQIGFNYYQLSMAMFWDVSRKYMECFDRPVWHVDWLNNFMKDYLGLAAVLRRNLDEGLPLPATNNNFMEGRICIATVCAYEPDHVLYGIAKISLQNRQQYVSRHGYGLVFKTKNDFSDSAGRHAVWTSIGLVLNLLKSSQYDYVMWMDCDAMYMNHSTRIEDLIQRYPGRDLYISEDGRGLSGGNWIVRNSNYSQKLLGKIFDDKNFDQWDLRDQFGFLWLIVGKALEALEPSRIVTKGARLESLDFFLRPKNFSDLGYPPQVALLPQRLINAYPWSLCRPSHYCFNDDGDDFIVSFITLGSLSRSMAFSLLYNFASRNWLTEDDVVVDDLLV
jgi:hypothetical protein